MKTFLDLTDIKTANRLEVVVELIEHDNPNYVFAVNEKQLQPVLYFDLLTDLQFSCKINNGAVEVAKITINGKEVMPIYLHLADPATNWITADWELRIPGPFYPWYHEITGQGWIA